MRVETSAFVLGPVRGKPRRRRRVLAERPDRALPGGARGDPLRRGDQLAELLMLSGVGPADHLKETGVEVRIICPASGRISRSIWRCISSSTAPSRSRSTPTPSRTAWRCQGCSGPDPQGGLHLGAPGGRRLHPLAGRGRASEPAVPFPASTVNDHGRKNGTSHAYQVHIGNMRQEARGWIKLKSANPKDIRASSRSTCRPRRTGASSATRSS